MDRIEIANRIKQVLEDNPIDGKPCTSYFLEKNKIMNSKTFSNIMNGKVRPNRNTLVTFCDFFKISIDWLLTGQESDYAINNCNTSNLIEIIAKLTNSLSRRDEEIERLTKIIDRLTVGTSPACEQENDVCKTGRNRDTDSPK